MGMPLLGGAEGAYPLYKLLATGDNVVTLSDTALAYNATTNPRGINSADDYDVWCEMFGTDLAIKSAAGVISKSGTAFTVVATANLNGGYVTLWIIPRGGGMRTVL